MGNARPSSGSPELGQNFPVFAIAKPQPFPPVFFRTFSRHSPEKPKLYSEPLCELSGSEYSFDSPLEIGVLWVRGRKSRVYSEPLFFGGCFSGSDYSLVKICVFRGVSRCESPGQGYGINTPPAACDRTWKTAWGSWGPSCAPRARRTRRARCRRSTVCQHDSSGHF